MFKIEEVRRFGPFRHIIVDTPFDFIEVPDTLSIKNAFRGPQDLPSSSDFPEKKRINFFEHPSIVAVKQEDGLPIAIDSAYDLLIMQLAILPKYARLIWRPNFKDGEEIIFAQLTVIGRYGQGMIFFEKKQSGEDVLEFDTGYEWKHDLCEKFNNDEQKFFVCDICRKIKRMEHLDGDRYGELWCKACASEFIYNNDDDGE